MGGEIVTESSPPADTPGPQLPSQPPTTVYHYTSASGFEAIVKSATLRATDFRYLNDAQELIYTWNKLLKKLEESAGKSEPTSQAHRIALKAIEMAGARDLTTSEYGTFITCFSELKESVNQWSLYADKGSGMALGFDVEKIRTIPVPYYRPGPNGKLELIKAVNTGLPMTWPSFLQKVEYGDAARATTIGNLISIIEQVYKFNESLGEPEQIANMISQITAFLPHVPLVKDRSFEYEREWRLTIPEHFGTAPPQIRALTELGVSYLAPMSQDGFGTLNVEFREGGAAIFRPYTTLSFDRSLLVEVVLGPNLQLPSIESTVRRLLNRYGYRDTKISQSASSYRGG
jgi:hypothetical protein